MLCVDPGKHHCGVARFEDARGRLVEAWLRPSWDLPTPRASVYERAVVEVPQVYRHGRGDPGDLIAITFAAGRAVALYDHVTMWTPAQWKGQTPKAIHHERMRAALTPSERSIVEAIDCAAKDRHNVFDAVCLGLHELGRI